MRMRRIGAVMAGGVIIMAFNAFVTGVPAGAATMTSVTANVSSNATSATDVTYSTQFTTATTATLTELQIALPIGTNISAATLGSVYGLGAGTFSAGKGAYDQNVYYGISCPTATECVMAGVGGVFYVEQFSGTSVTSAVEYAPSALAGDFVPSLACTSTTSCEVAIIANLSGGLGSGALANFNPSTGVATTQTTTSDGMAGVSCATSSDCAAVGYSGAAEYTTNGGSTWTAATSGTTETLLSVSCASGTTDCVAVGYGSSATVPVAIYSLDSGSSWSTPSSLPAGDGLRSVSCVSVNCLAGGLGGTIWLSVDSGVAWTAETSGTTASLWVQLGSVAGNAWGFGPGGVIVDSTNGGTTWASQTAPNSDDLLDAACGATNCVVTDATGALDTNNSGTTWAQMSGSVVPTIDYAVTTPASVAAGITIYFSADGIANPAVVESGPFIVHDYETLGGTPGYMVDVGASSNITYSANNTAATVIIPESLTFTNNTPAFTLLPIPNGGPVSDTVDLSVLTNAGSGYSVSAWSTPISATIGAHTYTLAQGSTSGSTSLAIDTFAAQASLTSGGTDGAALQGAYATSGNYVGYNATSPGADIVAASGPTGNTPDTIAIDCTTSVDYAQPAGTYTGTITYVVTPNY